MKDDSISRQAAIDAVDDWWITVDDNRHPVSVIKALPSVQSEQLDHCPIYGGMCGYPSNQCYDCPRHDEAKTASGMMMPSAQLEQHEIVRCKDCKWKQGAECVRFADVRPFPDDFCSRAERRTDECVD